MQSRLEEYPDSAPNCANCRADWATGKYGIVARDAATVDEDGLSSRAVDSLPVAVFKTAFVCSTLIGLTVSVAWLLADIKSLQ